MGSIADFVSEIKLVEKYTLILKNWRTQFDMVYRGLKLKNIEDKATEANDLNHIL